MALGYAIRRRGSFGDLSYRVVDITLDNAYAAGGWTLDPKSMGFGINGVILFALVSGAGRGGFLAEFNHSTGKLMMRDSSGGIGAATPETANNLAALNGIVVRMLVMGDGHG